MSEEARKPVMAEQLAAARDVSAFVAALRSLRIWVGDPSLARLRKLTGLPRSTLYDALDLRRSTLPSLELVQRFVRACGGDDELELWQSTWRRLKYELSMPDPHSFAETFPSQRTAPSAPGTATAPDAVQIPAGDLGQCRPPEPQPGGGWPIVGGTPRQLPLDVPTFVGRDDELVRLTELLRTPHHSTSPRLVVIHGPAGAGKSALAVRAANLLRDEFSDGQLYVDLRGATAGAAPLTPDEALGRLLRALGVPTGEVPQDVEESALLFRTMVASRRIVILLDNAAAEAQVRPLLPNGVDNAVLVTSRRSLAAIDGASAMSLGPLPQDAAIEMLGALLGDTRATAEPAATGQLVALCDRLPLGIQIAGARLLARPTLTISQFVDRLLDERYRLSELAAGDLGIRSSLAVSHERLLRSTDLRDNSAASALCLLGLVRLNHASADSAAALLGTTPIDAERILERLASTHLLHECETGQYRMPDLVRLYADDLASTLPSEAATEAVTRILHHYLATLREANRLAFPERRHYPVPEAEGPARRFADNDRAHRWFEAEWTNLAALVEQAMSGPERHQRLGVWLALSLHSFLTHHAYEQDKERRTVQAIAVARRQGDQHAEAYAQDCLGSGHLLHERFEPATEHLPGALPLLREDHGPGESAGTAETAPPASEDAAAPGGPAPSGRRRVRAVPLAVRARLPSAGQPHSFRHGFATAVLDAAGGNLVIVRDADGCLEEPADPPLPSPIGSALTVGI